MPLDYDVPMLQHSARANKYDGYKSPSVAETRVSKSKVKARVVPEASNAPNTTSAHQLAVPPPTPVAVLQAVGTTRCGIPPEDLSTDKLMADQEGSSSSSAFHAAQTTVERACLERARNKFREKTTCS